MTERQNFLIELYREFGDKAQNALDFVRKNDGNSEPAVKKEQEIPTDYTAVDLGLPSGTLWCDRNIGAKSPEDYGGFFSWGNTELHFPNRHNADWGDDDEAFNCIYSFDSETYEKTEGAKLQGDIDAEHDAATINLGKPWCLPSKNDFQELYDNCVWKRVTTNGVNGYLVTSKINGNSIFFPCSGYGLGSSWNYRGGSGYYWSSSLLSAARGRHLLFYSGGVSPQSNDYRFYGFVGRAVQKSS